MRPGIMTLAQEELEDEVVADTGADVAETTVESPEAELGEAAEAATELANHDESVDAAISTAGDLDNVAERVEATLPEGGMGEAEADALRVAVEAMCASVGFPASIRKKTFPAMEGFGVQASRVESTKLAMEGIKERAKQIWDQIVAWCKKWWGYAMNFFKSLFDAATKLQNRGDKLVKLAASKKGAVIAADAKIKVPGSLSVGGKIVGGAELAGAIEKHVNQDILYEDRAGELKNAVGLVDKLIGEKAAEGAHRAMMDWQGKLNKGSASSNKSVAGEGQTAYEIPLVFGGRSFFTLLGSGENAVSKAMVGESAKAAEGGEVAPIPVEDAGKAAGAVAGHLKTVYADAKKAVTEAEAAAKALIAKISEAAKEEGSNARAISTAVRSATALTTSAAVSLKSYDIKVCAAALNAVAASLKEAKAEKAATPAA